MTDEIDRLRADLKRAQIALASALGRPRLEEARRRARFKHLRVVGAPELPTLPTSMESAKSHLADAHARHKGCKCQGLDRYKCKAWQDVQWCLSGDEHELELAR